LPGGNLRHDVPSPSPGAPTACPGAATNSATTNATVFHIIQQQGARTGPGAVTA
jgi:hypothetical protein